MYETKNTDPWRFIDIGIRPYVRTFNEIPGLTSHSSCSGHPGIIGDIFDGYKNVSAHWIETNSKKGPTLEWGIIPHLGFHGNNTKAIDYLDYISSRLSETSYGRKLFQYNYLQGYWTIQVDHTSEWNPDRIGYWELMANWERLRQFTEEYVESANYSEFKKTVFDPREEDANWKTIDRLIKKLEKIDALNKNL